MFSVILQISSGSYWVADVTFQVVVQYYSYQKQMYIFYNYYACHLYDLILIVHFKMYCKNKS